MVKDDRAKAARQRAKDERQRKKREKREARLNRILQGRKKKP